MKTIHGWILTLPEEQRSKALSNMSKYPFSSMHDAVGSLPEAIVRAFIWGRGEGTIKYWHDIYQGNNTELF